MIRTICLLYCLAISAMNAQTREDKTDIRNTIGQFFFAMFSGDILQLAGILEPGAVLTTISADPSGGNAITYSNRRSFLMAVRTLHTGMALRECLYNREISVDSEGATVVCSYHFFAKHQYTHSGHDTFILHRRKSGWKIVAISDTRFVLARPPKHECD